MKKLQLLLMTLIVFAALAVRAQVPFTPGNLVISRIGDGSAMSASTACPVFLDEYTPSGTLVQSIALPTSVSGSNRALTLQGDYSKIGALTLSPDKHFLAIGGVDASPGTSMSLINLNPNTYNRVSGIVNYNGLVNTSSAVNAFGMPRSSITSNGIDIWTGYGGDAPIRYTTLGGSSYIDIDDFEVFNKLGISNGQLYGCAGSGRIFKIGAGLPTAFTSDITVLPGFPSDSENQFVFADMDASIPGNDVVYTASQGNTALRKYSLVGGTWVSNGQIGVLADVYTGLTAVISGINVVLYALKGGIPSVTGTGEVVSITDNSGYNGAFAGTPSIVIPSFAGSNKNLRGIALAPIAPSVKVAIKTYFQGAYSTSAGRHKDVTTTWAGILNANATSQPYNTAAFGSYAGTESVSNSFFTSNSGSDQDVVDWVLVELRDSANPATVIKKRAGFILEDGRIVDLDKTSDINFNNAPPYITAGNYYVVVRHRNHLSVRSNSLVAAGSTPTLYDFTTAQSQAYQNPAITGNAAMSSKDMLGATPGVFLMWGGNGNSDTETRASGGSLINDYLTLMNPSNLNGNTSTIISNVYRSVDMNLDGSVRASASFTLSDYLTLMSPGILNGNTSNRIIQH